MNDNEAEQRREELIVRMGRAISPVSYTHLACAKETGARSSRRTSLGWG